MMEIKINVEIGLRPGLEGFLRGLMGLAGTPARVEAEPSPQVTAEPSVAPEPEPSPQEQPTAEVAVEEAPQEALPEAPAPQEPQEALPEAQAPQGAPEPEEISDEELRNQMDKLFKKFLGEGGEDSKEREVALRRRSLTDCFKRIAQHLGASKPTGLPADKRQDFLLYLDSIKQEGDSGLCVWDPF